MSNQFNKTISDSNLKNKNTILMGCFPEDWKLCKRLGRKIYWLMQNHIYGREDEFFFLGYILAHDISIEKLSKFKAQLNNKQIEPLYFDTNSQLIDGLRKNTMHLRTYNKNGILIREEHLTEMDKMKVLEIYKQLTIPREKVFK